MRTAVFDFLDAHETRTTPLVSLEPNRRLPRFSAAEAGISARAIEALVAALDRSRTTHSLMLVRDGGVVAEHWWEPFHENLPHAVFSVSKSFTAVAVGFAVAEGLLDLDDRVVDLLPDDAPDRIDERLARLRIRHLLTMTTGHATDTVELAQLAASGGWAPRILHAPLDHEPGERFVYNSGATYLLSAIVTRLTGQRLLHYLAPRLFDPLGIRDATWEQSPEGIDAGGWGLFLRTEDLAVFGELVRCGGEWQGRRIVPAAWLDAATSTQVGNARRDSDPDWSVGYGYQFWRGRHGSYRADGAFGQFVVILPLERTVLALTGGAAQMQPTLDLVWQHLLPGLAAGPDRIGSAPAPRRDPLRLPVIAGGPPGDRAGFELTVDDDQFTGIRRFSVDGSPVRISDQRGPFAITFGTDGWVPGTLRLNSGVVPIAASGAWLDGHRWTGLIWFTTTPFRLRIDITLDDDQTATIRLEMNVAFGPTRLGSAVGHVVRAYPEKGDVR